MEQEKQAHEMELGVASMDASHNELLHQLEQLKAVPDHEFPDFYLALVAKIERDFRSEELLMEDLDFAGLKTHREQHARVLGGLHHVAPRVCTGDVSLGRHALDLLPQWFQFHIATMDRSLADAVRKAEGAGKALVR